ncbi:hypothetical protein VTJ83DRAFT_3604 [Remersonia thermophila]|uniref:Integral membrane protein n=1 Tax=Remersonia thermophila TaxID=72144 RepID=A0ABR4DEG5_9PEZI
MPTPCSLQSSADLYGLGIRLSFYLLWFSVLVGERLHERHAQVPRAVELVLAYAVALALAMAASRGVLTPADAYAALLLVSTTVYLLVPRYVTDLASWARPDLGLGTPVARGRSGFGLVGAARSGFVLGVVGLHLWFWADGVASPGLGKGLCCSDGERCQAQRYTGFAFGPLDMRSGGFRAMNVLLMLTLLAGGAVVGAMKAGLRRRKKFRRQRQAKYVNGGRAWGVDGR